MGVKDVMRSEPGNAYMLANEAIVRYALESDVKVVSFYPGAPQTEVLDTFEKMVGTFDIRMEIASNEKVALETVAGASMAGQRSLTSMKSVGTNVASDALYSLAYTGVKAGCVCIIADDPHCHSSQSEQDGRWFGYTAYLPMLEPSNPQEAGEMVKFAFELSERYGTIVLVRTTTRVNHQSGLVRVNEISRTPFVKNTWKEIKHDYVTVGQAAREAKALLLKKMDSISEELADSDLNRREHYNGSQLVEGWGDASIGIIANGINYAYTIEALRRLGLKANVLKLGILNPIPGKAIIEFVERHERVVVVEELTPYLEVQVRSIAQGMDVDILGKRTGHFSEMLEYNVPIVTKALSDISGTPMNFDYDAHVAEMSSLAEFIPERLPVFCAGCPHRATFWAVRRAVRIPDSVFFANDIGCYSMMSLKPVEWSNTLLCMGASLGISSGVQYSIDGKTIAAIGDSTLFHAGLPGIVNMVHNNDDVTLFILDNSVTAMTGQQSHPGRDVVAGGLPGRKVGIRSVVEGIGVEKIVEIDAFKGVKDNVAKVKEALEFEGPSVVISHGECALYHFRNYRHAGGRTVPFRVNRDECEKAHACIFNFMCPAISLDEEGYAVIAEDICVGCGVCSQLCPHGAIHSTALDKGGEDRPYTEVADYNDLVGKEVVE